MKKMFLRYFSVLSVLALVFSCAACGGTDTVPDESVVEFVEYEEDLDTDTADSESSDSSKKGTTSSQKGSGSVTKDKDGNIKVTLDTENNSGDTAAQKKLQNELKDSCKGKTVRMLSASASGSLVNQCYISMFKDICGGTLKIITCTDWDQMQQKLVTMHVAGNAPELYEMTNQDFPSMVYREVLATLDDKIDFNSEVYTKKDRQTLSNLKFNGKTYFWPTYTNVATSRPCVWVNKSLMQKAGVSSDKMPSAQVAANTWTWDSMYELVRKCADKDKNIYGLATPQNTSFPYAMVSSTGEDFVKLTSNGIVSNLKSTNVTRAMNMYKKFMNSSYTTVADAYQFFAEGKAAMIFSNTYNITDVKLQAMVKQGILDIVPMARDPQKDNYYIMGTLGGIAIPSGTKDMTSSVNFVKMLRASDYYNQQVKDIYFEEQQYTDGAIKYCENAVDKYVIQPVFSLGIKEILQLTWNSCGSDFINGDVTWETRAEEYNGQIQSILDKLG